MPLMPTPSERLRVLKAREWYIQHNRQRRFDESIFVPLETTQLWLCVADRTKQCHLTALSNTEAMSGLATPALKDDKGRDESSVTWFIYHKDKPTEQIGSIWLFQFSSPDARTASAMLGYTLAERARGKGFMSEALSAVIRFAFETLGLNRIEARVRWTNERSKGVVTRAGFKNVGVVRKGKWALGDTEGIEIVESEIWILTKGEWQAHLTGSFSNASL
jgi:RimJ/RimL family protein N-acetyltransferase